MNELMRTTELQTPIEVLLKIDEQGRTTARDLYEFLDLAKGQFARWAKSNITNNPFAEESLDFIGFDIVVEGNVIRDYSLSADFAKKLAMGSNSSQGEVAKNYFILVESKLKEVQLKANLLLQIYNGGQGGILASRQLSDMEVIEATKELTATIETQKPLVDFANHVTDSADSIDIGELAKLANKESINIGRNRLFTFLKDNKILMSNNIPYQKYIDNKWFTVIEVVKTTPYGDKIFTKTMAQGKGQVGVIELLRNNF